jgi:hypothetical protein
MPQVCVSCGTTTESDLKWKIRWGQIEKDKMTLSVDFPICMECGVPNKKSKGLAKFIWWIFIILSLYVACLVYGLVISTDIDYHQYIGVAAGIVVLVLMIKLGSWLSDRIDTSGLTPSQKQQWKLEKKRWSQNYKKLLKCAKIVKVKLAGLFESPDKGYIDFEFENELFAMEFSALNLGQLTYK